MSEPITPPIVAASTFRFADTEQVLRAVQGQDGHYLYSRWANPTVAAVEAQVAGLCGAERALAFSSGMAAISAALLCGLHETPRLLCHTDVYGGTFELARDLLPRWGVAVETFPSEGWEQVVSRESPGTVGVIYVETPTNPTLRVVDLRRLSEEARRLGALLVVDNTFASPVHQRPLALGADVEVHSATKYLGGHHDLLAGVVAGGAAFCDRLWTYRKLLGGCLDAFPAFLLHRGLKTLEVRVQRQSETALRLARWLQDQPGVGQVHYPGLPEHPQHAIAAAQMTGWGGMLSFEIEAGYAAAVRFSDALEHFALAPSLGGTESLVTLPRTTSHVGLSSEELAQAGLGEGMVRVSVGLEPYDRLQADLVRGLRAAEGRATPERT